MNYALNLAEDNRILSACVILPNGNYNGMPIVDTLPEGNVVDYLCVNGTYVYAPMPEEPEHTPVPDANEVRIAALEEELAAAKILLGVE